MQTDTKLFKAKIEDLFSACRRKNIVKFSPFLDDSEQYMAKQIADLQGLPCMFFGGYDNATRKMLGVFPDYLEPDGVHFPVSIITAEYKKEYTLSHRDFLGALMGLKIKREVVGDIVIGEGKTILMVSNTVEKCVMQELQKVGRVGVKLSLGFDTPIENKTKFEIISGTVASIRLDTVVSLLTRLSRERSVALIKSGTVCVNYKEQCSVSSTINVDDIITIRGYGKFIFCGTDGVTKKERLHITCKKYI